jgi:hypothetical protein
MADFEIADLVAMREGHDRGQGKQAGGRQAFDKSSQGISSVLGGAARCRPVVGQLIARLSGLM